MAKCKSKLNEIGIPEAESDFTRAGSTAAKVTQNVTQSILIKMKELSNEYISYKSR